MVLAAALVAASGRPEPATAPRRVSLRLRDVPIHSVLFALFRLTGQGYVVDADVVGRVDVDLVDATPEPVHRALEGAGLALSGPGPIRRVSLAGQTPSLARPGSGHPVSLEFKTARRSRCTGGSATAAEKGGLQRLVDQGADDDRGLERCRAALSAPPAPR